MHIQAISAISYISEIHKTMCHGLLIMCNYAVGPQNDCRNNLHRLDGLQTDTNMRLCICKPIALQTSSLSSLKTTTTSKQNNAQPFWKCKAPRPVRWRFLAFCRNVFPVSSYQLTFLSSLGRSVPHLSVSPACPVLSVRPGQISSKTPTLLPDKRGTPAPIYIMQVQVHH